MRLGVSNYSFESHVKKNGCDYTEICRLAREMGFEGIEFVALDSGVFKAGEDPAESAEKIKECCEKEGLEIIAYTVGANLLSENIEEEVCRAKARIDVAALLGAPIFRHDVCYSLKKIEGYTFENAIEEMVPVIRELSDYAAEKGIRTCTENHGYVFQDPHRVKALMEAVDHPNYGWLCDIGNFLCVDADVIESVKIAAPFTLHVHAKDFLWRPGTEERPEGYFGTSGGNHLKGTVIGDGAVPVKESLDILKKAGYNGWVSLEFEGSEDPLDALKTGKERLLQWI
jgi:sugar phosphate isomerase/epimerase